MVLKTSTAYFGQMIILVQSCLSEYSFQSKLDNLLVFGPDFPTNAQWRNYDCMESISQHILGSHKFSVPVRNAELAIMTTTVTILDMKWNMGNS